MFKQFLKNLNFVLFLLAVILRANFSQAKEISSYDELVSVLRQRFSVEKAAGLKKDIQDTEQKALDQILNNELRFTFAERQYILRQSKESLPSKVFEINQNYIAIGFEKTMRYKGVWEKAAYILLFEFDPSENLEYTGSYLFWRGKSSFINYKSIDMYYICSNFPVLAQLDNCGSGPLPKGSSQTNSQKFTSPIPQKSVPKNSTLTKRVDGLYRELNKISVLVKGKADQKHTHNGRDITSGVVKDNFIDAAIARDREFQNWSGSIASSGNPANIDDAYIKGLENRIMELENTVTNLLSLLEGVSKKQNNLIFSGVNVQIVNGTGSTFGPVNGLGNLIVGYNEPRGGSHKTIRTGSHNIVVGGEHNYLSYGGLVAGLSNTISGTYSSVVGGLWNEASGDFSTVAGGHFVTAEGVYSVSQTGTDNAATKQKNNGGCGGCGGCDDSQSLR